MKGKEKACAGLSYLLIGIIWFFVDKEMRNSHFVKFHAGQGIVLLLVGVVAAVLNTILVIIPVIGWLAIVAINVCLLILWVYGIWNVLTGKQKELFVIGQYAKKLKL